MNAYSVKTIMTEKLKNLPTFKNQILKNVKIICSAVP